MISTMLKPDLNLILKIQAKRRQEFFLSMQILLLKWEKRRLVVVAVHLLPRKEAHLQARSR